MLSEVNALEKDNTRSSINIIQLKDKCESQKPTVASYKDSLHFLEQRNIGVSCMRLVYRSSIASEKDKFSATTR